MSETNIYMTIAEYAAHLKLGRQATESKHKGERTVNNLIKKGLPSVKIGKSRRILWQQADQWLLQNSLPSNKPERKTRAKRPESLNNSATLETVALPATDERAA